MKRLLRFGLLGASALVLSQACGSSEDKKKQPPHYALGGEAGEAAGGSSSSGKNTGASSGSGVGATSGEGSGGDAAGGTANMTTGGESSGGLGAGGSGANCPTGFGDCDDNPADCEQDLNLVTSCGDCNKSCSTANANVTCEDQKCVVKSCMNGFVDCVNGGDDGCESKLTSDDHCGSCERNCAALGSTCATDKCNEIPLQTTQPIGSDSGVNRTWAFSPDGLLHMGSNSYQVNRYPLDGSARALLWNSTSKRGGWNSLLVIGDTVYWSELGTPTNDFTSAVFTKKILDTADVTPTLMWVPEWQPMFLRKQGNVFYWFSGEYQSGDPGAWIYTRAVNAPLADPGTKIMSVDQTPHNGVVAFNVTADALYWITAVPGTGVAYELRTTPLAGGTPTVVPNAPGAQNAAVTRYAGTPDLEVVDKTLYFNRDAADALDGIYSFKKGDAAPVWLVHAAGVRTFVVDDKYFYYHLGTGGAGVWKAPITGGAGVRISDDGISRIVGQDDKFIYTIASACCSGNVAKVIK